MKFSIWIPWPGERGREGLTPNPGSITPTYFGIYLVTNVVFFDTTPNEQQK